jgi:hypothetical protein
MQKREEKETIPDYIEAEFKHIVEAVGLERLKNWTAIVIKGLEKKA